MTVIEKRKKTLYEAFAAYRAYWDILNDLEGILDRYDGLMQENDFQAWLLTALQDKPEGYKDIISLNCSYELEDAYQCLLDIAQQYEDKLKGEVEKVLKGDTGLKKAVLGKELKHDKKRLNRFFEVYSCANMTCTNEEAFGHFIDCFGRNY